MDRFLSWCKKVAKVVSEMTSSNKIRMKKSFIDPSLLKVTEDSLPN
jgi:hypothetical protein